MPEPFMPQDRLMVALDGDLAMIRVAGRGSFKVGPALKDFAMCAQERGVRRFLFDMAECVSMDSTFMGVVAGIALRTRQDPQGEVVFVHLSERTRHLLRTLGLDTLVKIQETAAVPTENEPEFHDAGEHPVCPAPSRRRTTQTMLEAHLTLTDMNPENEKKFKDVVAYLREDLARPEEHP